MGLWGHRQRVPKLEFSHSQHPGAPAAEHARRAAGRAARRGRRRRAAHGREPSASCRPRLHPGAAQAVRCVGVMHGSGTPERGYIVDLSRSRAAVTKFRVAPSCVTRVMRGVFGLGSVVWRLVELWLVVRAVRARLNPHGTSSSCAQAQRTLSLYTLKCKVSRYNIAKKRSKKNSHVEEN